MTSCVYTCACVECKCVRVVVLRCVCIVVETVVKEGKVVELLRFVM